MILRNYCHPDCVPMRNIMRLGREGAFALAAELAHAHPATTAFYRFADFENYYALRERQDAYLSQAFRALGGRCEEEHPLSFVVGESGYLREWFAFGIETVLPLSAVDACHVSFTVGDSGALIGKGERPEVLTVGMLRTQLAAHGDVDALLHARGCSYIEAQLWSDRYLAAAERIVHGEGSI